MDIWTNMSKKNVIIYNSSIIAVRAYCSSHKYSITWAKKTFGQAEQFIEVLFPLHSAI